MPKLGFRGANVTIPHKERALEIADFVSERAQRIGAANTLYFDVDGKIHADNTDGYGFITNLKKVRQSGVQRPVLHLFWALGVRLGQF